MTKPTLILIGAGGHARACIDEIERDDKYQIIGLVGLPHQKTEKYFGYPVIGIDADLPQIAKYCECALVSVGQIQSNNDRKRLYQQALLAGFKLPTIISVGAYISKHASIGFGNIIMHGVSVGAGACIGDNCIINSHVLIEHDVVVGDHCHISTGAILNGGSVVNSNTFIGSGTVVKHGITIGGECIVGMGLAVRHNINDHVKFTGYDS